MASTDWQSTFATSRDQLHRYEAHLAAAAHKLRLADLSSPLTQAVDALTEIAKIHLRLIDDLRAGMEDD
jgi:isocitrate dehydrogenase kinase/phosphatase